MKTRRILALLLALVTLFSCLSISVFADNTANLDTDTSKSKDIDQNYTFKQAGATSYTEAYKVKLAWEVTDIAVTYVSTKTWNPDTMTWDETKTVADITDQTATFTLTNYSSKKVAGTASFTAETALASTLSSATFDDNNGKTIDTMVNADKTVDETKKTTVPSNTITATLKFNKDEFANLSAATSATKYGTYTITLAALKDATVTAPTAKTGLTYTDSEQELVTAGTTDGGEWQYKLGDGEYSTAVPKAKDAGIYTVYYKLVGGDNYNDIAEDSVPVAIANYLTFTATLDSTITPNFATGTAEYSEDGGATWQDATNGTAIQIAYGESICMRNKGNTACTTDDSHYFSMTGSIAASGDVTSLTNGVGGDVNLAEAYSDLDENSGCYQCMFCNCGALTTAPNLPSTILSNYCYNAMFGGCSALASAPNLPATTLTKACYMQMFRDCSSLRIVSSNGDDDKKIFTCTVDCITNDGANGNWEVTGMFQGTNLLDENATPTNGETYWWYQEACFAAGTKITMSDHTTKNIEDVIEGDSVLTFNHEAGVYEAQEVYLVWSGEDKAKAFTLHFDNGNTLSIVGEHDLFAKESLKYVTMNESTAEQYIGKHFYSAADGKYAELTGVTYETEEVDFYSLYVGYNANCIANGMLSVSVEAEDSLNIYEIYEDLTIDRAQLEKDVAEYGLFEYPADAAYSKEYYDALQIRYVNIMVGKGLVTWAELTERIEAGLDNENE